MSGKVIFTAGRQQATNLGVPEVILAGAKEIEQSFKVQYMRACKS